jgi:hypothetical protein
MCHLHLQCQRGKKQRDETARRRSDPSLKGTARGSKWERKRWYLGWDWKVGGVCALSNKLHQEPQIHIGCQFVDTTHLSQAVLYKQGVQSIGAFLNILNNSQLLRKYSAL